MGAVSKNRDRLLEAEVARKFLAELLDHKEVRGLLSDEHFSVDGTLIAAWASAESLRAKDGSGEPPTAGRPPAIPATRSAKGGES